MIIIYPFPIPIKKMAKRSRGGVNKRAQLVGFLMKKGYSMASANQKIKELEKVHGRGFWDTLKNIGSSIASTAKDAGREIFNTGKDILKEQGKEFLARSAVVGRAKLQGAMDRYLPVSAPPEYDNAPSYEETSYPAVQKPTPAASTPTLSKGQKKRMRQRQNKMQQGGSGLRIGSGLRLGGAVHMIPLQGGRKFRAVPV